MSLQALGARIKMLAQSLEQSMVNHNALAGRLAEAKETLSFLQNIPGPIGEAAKAVSLAEAIVEPVVDAVVDAVDSASKATTPAATTVNKSGSK
jgi:hypothetical protein